MPLTWTDASGLTVRKVFVVQARQLRDRAAPGNHQQEQRDRGAATRTASCSACRRSSTRSGIKAYSNTERYSFIGAAWYNASDKFQKLKFDNFAKEPLNKSFAGGWAAMLQHYFFAAWIPDAAETDQYTTAVVQNADAPRYLIRTLSPAITRRARRNEDRHRAPLCRPEAAERRSTRSRPGLSLTVDYGIFTVISEPLHWILAQFHKLTGNWGFAIILLVVLIKAAFFKLSEAQYRSMARMRKMQPRIEALKERYGDDRQKMNQAMLELYQKEKINPLGGCLPMLVQIPVFFALYWVLLESVELRQAPFILWIQNLSAPDPYFVLPVLNGLAMIATQWLTPSAGMDPMQAKMMKIMPVAFSVLFAFFPAGLVLYWTVNGTLSLLQQWIITKRIESAATRPKRDAMTPRDTIAAVATPPGAGGVGVIRVSGARSAAIARKLLRPRSRAAPRVLLRISPTRTARRSIAACCCISRRRIRTPAKTCSSCRRTAVRSCCACCSRASSSSARAMRGPANSPSARSSTASSISRRPKPSPT